MKKEQIFLKSDFSYIPKKKKKKKKENQRKDDKKGVLFKNLILCYQFFINNQTKQKIYKFFYFFPLYDFF